MIYRNGDFNLIYYEIGNSEIGECFVIHNFDIGSKVELKNHIPVVQKIGKYSYGDGY